MSETVGIDASTTTPFEEPPDADLLPGRRRPNQPLTPDSGQAGDAGDETVEIAADDAIERVGQAILNETNGQLQSEDGREELGSDIDGLASGERTAGEARAIDDTLDDLDTEDTLDVDVIAVEAGEVETIMSDEGHVQSVTLGEAERSKLLDFSDGETVLLVADDLTVEEVIEEVVDTQTDLITEVAEDNGVVVDAARLRAALFARATAVFEGLFRIDVQRGYQDLFVGTVDRWAGRSIGEPDGR